MSSAEKTLDELRREIDEIDAQIHDLLIRRTEVTSQVGHAKKRAQAEQVQFLRPGREAQVLRRLVARHRGDFPKLVLVRIWREIFAAATAQQGGFSISVEASDDLEGLRWLARDHFGGFVPVSEQGSAQRVVNVVSEGQAQVGLLPLPDSGDNAWWTMLAIEDAKAPRIVARLPFAALNANGPQALAVGLSRQEDTGDDRSYLILENDSESSRAGVKTLAEKAGFQVVELQSSQGRSGVPLILIEVEGFVDDGDPRLDQLRYEGREGGAPRLVWHAGGYARPLSPEELV